MLSCFPMIIGQTVHRETQPAPVRCDTTAVGARACAKVVGATEVTLIIAVVARRTQRRMLPCRPALERKTIGGVAPVTETPRAAAAVNARSNEHMRAAPGQHLHLFYGPAL